MTKHEKFIRMFIGIVTSALLLILLSAVQKYILLGKIILEPQGYYIPMVFGAVTGIIITHFFMRQLELTKLIKKENRILEEKNKMIQQLNQKLQSTLNKYELIVDSIINLNRYKSYSEEDFICKIVDISMDILSTYDNYVVFKCDEDYLELIQCDGPIAQKTKLSEISSSVTKEIFTTTGLYTWEQLEHKLEEQQKNSNFIQQIKNDSKELLFLNIHYKNEKIGGIMYQINHTSYDTFNDYDVSIIKALSSIFENYYESIEFEEIKEQQLINIVEAMVSMLEFHDSYTKEHSLNVARLGRLIGKEMGLKEQLLNEIYLVGLLHDIGKTFINHQILNKKGKLTQEEYKKIQEHPSIGYDILSNINDLSVISEAVLYHHERCDGKGYPEGLVEEEIPKIAKIIHVADSYDAMTSDRPYRKALSQAEAIAEVKNNLGTQFCEKAGRLLIQLVENNKDASELTS